MSTTRTRFDRALVAKLSDARERFHQLAERAHAADAHTTATTNHAPQAPREPREVRRG